MEKFTIKVKYKDGSSTWQTCYADNFGHACMVIYNDSAHQSFIDGFEKRTF